jgi:hypothetical protein
MSASFEELVLELVETGFHGAIELPIADTHNESAEQFGIDLFFEQRLDLEEVGELFLHRPAVAVRRARRLT